MGHKIHPRSIRLGYIQDWRSRWFAPKNMPALIMEDFQIRKIVDDKFKMAAVSYVGIERAGAFLRLNRYSTEHSRHDRRYINSPPRAGLYRSSRRIRCPRRSPGSTPGRSRSPFPIRA